MSQLINFSNYRVPNDHSTQRLKAQNSGDIQPTIDISDDEYKMTINILVHNNPNKTSFTFDEAASQLNIGTEFIRRRVKAGRIKVIYFGDKPLIHISELARLLTKGIK